MAQLSSFVLGQQERKSDRLVIHRLRKESSVLHSPPEWEQAIDVRATAPLDYQGHDFANLPAPACSESLPNPGRGHSLRSIGSQLL